MVSVDTKPADAFNSEGKIDLHLGSQSLPFTGGIHDVLGDSLDLLWGQGGISFKLQKCSVHAYHRGYAHGQVKVGAFLVGEDL